MKDSPRVAPFIARQKSLMVDFFVPTAGAGRQGKPTFDCGTTSNADILLSLFSNQ
jgi:hypothetical protein